MQEKKNTVQNPEDFGGHANINVTLRRETANVDSARCLYIQFNFLILFSTREREL